MLILTRNIGTNIIIGDDIKITVVNMKGGQVVLGITAPKEISIHREEIYEKIKKHPKIIGKTKKNYNNNNEN